MFWHDICGGCARYLIKYLFKRPAGLHIFGWNVLDGEKKKTRTSAGLRPFKNQYTGPDNFLERAG